MAFMALFKPISNQGDWATWIKLSDRATGEALDLSSCTFSLALALNGDSDASYILTGSTANGELTSPSLGYLQIFFPVSRMQGLVPGSYLVGLTMTNGVYTKQLILGLLPIVAGIVNLSNITPLQGDYS